MEEKQKLNENIMISSLSLYSIIGNDINIKIKKN